MAIKDCIRIPTASMSREEWLGQRRKGIGGSDAGSLVGLSKYGSPYTVYCDKLGLLPPKEDTEAMRLGRDLEEYVSRRWEEATGKKCAILRAILVNRDYPFAFANIDRRVLNENAILECKTTSELDTRVFSGVEFPERYYAQCVHYMAVTGADTCYLSVLVFGRGYFHYTLKREDVLDEMQALLEAEEAFWRQNVERRIPPAISGAKADSEALGTVYGETNGGSIDLDYMRDVMDSLQTAKDAKAAAEERVSSLENQIKAAMGPCESAGCGKWKVTWKAQERKSLDTDRLRAEHPEIDLSRYYKVSRSRVFRVAENKKGR